MDSNQNSRPLKNQTPQKLDLKEKGEPKKNKNSIPKKFEFLEKKASKDLDVK